MTCVDDDANILIDDVGANNLTNDVDDVNILSKDDLADADAGPPGHAGVAVCFEQVQDAPVHRRHLTNIMKLTE